MVTITATKQGRVVATVTGTMSLNRQDEVIDNIIRDHGPWTLITVKSDQGTWSIGKSKNVTESFDDLFE